MEENRMGENILQEQTPVVTDGRQYTQTVKSPYPMGKVWVVPTVVTLLVLSISAAAWLGMNL